MAFRATSAIMLAAALALAVAGCGGSGTGSVAGGGRPSATGTVAEPAANAGTATSPGTSSPGSVTGVCGPPNAPGRLTTIRASDGVRLAAIEAGSGERGVVLIPELGAAGKCGWWDYAAYLAARGFRVVLFDHRCTGESSCPPGGTAPTGLTSDIQGAVNRLRQQGATAIALLGASQGGAEALITATLPQRGVTGVAALSADELSASLAADPFPATALAAAARLRLPVLFAVANGDPYVSVQQTRQLYQDAGSRHKQLVILGPEQGHGWDLVTAQPDGLRPVFSGTLVAFLRTVTS
jgi:alpha-beta hydrolase superfamily lysophospholipase